MFDKRTLCLFVLLACFAPYPARAVEPASRRVLGAWRLDEPVESFEVSLFISADKLVFDDGRRLYVIIDDRDGRAALRVAGADTVVCVATMLDDDSADIFFPERGTNYRFARIAAAATAGIGIDKVYGYWLAIPVGRDGGKRELVIQIVPGFLRIQGEGEEPIAIHPMAGEFKIVSPSSSKPPLILRFTGPGMIELYSKNELIGRMTSLSEEEAQKRLSEEK